MRSPDLFFVIWFLLIPVVVYAVTRWTKLGRMPGIMLGVVWPAAVLVVPLIAAGWLLWKVADLAWHHAGQYEEPVSDDDGGW